jgi:DNA-binding transcriptional ArsR family regulator
MKADQYTDATGPLTGLRGALHRALANPLRHRMLVILDERVASPKELSEEVDEPLDKVSYHVRYLAGLTPANPYALIELVDMDIRRGGVQHFYKAIERPIIGLPESELLPRSVRERSTKDILPLMHADIERAVAAGTFDSHHARSLLRLHLDADQAGIVETGEASMRYLAELQEIEARSANRIAESGEQPVRLATATLAFELPTD